MTELLAAMPEARTALLAEHRRDHTGHGRRCAVANGVAPVWPCRLRLLAESAERLAAEAASQRGETAARPFSRQASARRTS